MRRARMFANAMLANLFATLDPENCEFDPANKQDSHFFDKEMLSALPLDIFWTPVIEKLARDYAAENWLSRIDPSFRLFGAWINESADGRFFVLEMSYNKEGHRSLIAIPVARILEIIENPVIRRAFRPEPEFVITDILCDDDIHVWMD